MVAPYGSCRLKGGSATAEPLFCDADGPCVSITLAVGNGDQAAHKRNKVRILIVSFARAWDALYAGMRVLASSSATAQAQRADRGPLETPTGAYRPWTPRNPLCYACVV
jgi:hypothetical protein